MARSVDTHAEHMQTTLERAGRHKGSAFVEVLQNCNIFNDGAWRDFTDREVREDRMLVLEDGKPMIFGKDRDKGIRLRGLHPEVVTIGENGVTEADLLVHDDPSRTRTWRRAVADVLAGVPGPGRRVPGRRATDTTSSSRATSPPRRTLRRGRSREGAQRRRDVDREVIAGEAGSSRPGGRRRWDARPRCARELVGADICDNCGADIFGHDTPLQAPAFAGQLLGEHLDDLGSPAPITVGPDTPIDVAIARMHEAGVDCVLVVADDRLVGIFTIATQW